MNRYRFYLVKQGAFRRGSYAYLSKTKEIIASDSKAARKEIEDTYPDWQVSMFWPVIEKSV